MKSAASASIGHIGLQTEGAPHALAALAALGQPTRLEIFRLLMRREQKGLAAGSIAKAFGCPQNTLSSHLAILARAGLTFGTRVGRSVIYRADIEGMRALVEFLVSDCCSGHPQLCNFEQTNWDQGCNQPKGRAVRKVHKSTGRHWRGPRRSSLRSQS